MEISLTTATVTVGKKTAPLTKAIVKQLAWFTPMQWTRGQVQGVGSVDLGDALSYLLMTPDGLQRTSQQISGVTNDKRIILL